MANEDLSVSKAAPDDTQQLGDRSHPDVLSDSCVCVEVPMNSNRDGCICTGATGELSVRITENDSGIATALAEIDFIRASLKSPVPTECSEDADDNTLLDFLQATTIEYPETLKRITPSPKLSLSTVLGAAYANQDELSKLKQRIRAILIVPFAKQVFRWAADILSETTSEDLPDHVRNALNGSLPVSDCKGESNTCKKVQYLMILLEHRMRHYSVSESQLAEVLQLPSSYGVAKHLSEVIADKKYTRRRVLGEWGAMFMDKTVPSKQCRNSEVWQQYSNPGQVDDIGKKRKRSDDGRGTLSHSTLCYDTHYQI